MSCQDPKDILFSEGIVDTSLPVAKYFEKCDIAINNILKCDISINSINTCDLTINNIAIEVNTAPSAPTGVEATGGDTIADISWDANTEEDLEGYNVYVGGVKNNSSIISGTTYQVTGLTNDTPYDIKVTAVDTEGLESSFSSTVTVTPSAPSYSIDFPGGSDAKAQTSWAGILGTSEFTIEFWIKTTSNNSDDSERIIGWGDDTTTAAKFHVRIDPSSGNLRCEWGGGKVISDTGISDGSWHHVGIQKPEGDNGSNLQFIVDGVQTGTIDRSTNNVIDLSVNRDFTFGYAHQGNFGSISQQSFDGMLDEIRVWSVIRTQQEINNNKDTVIETIPNSLEVYFSCDDNSDTSVAIDSTSNGRDASLIDCSYVSDVPF